MIAFLITISICAFLGTNVKADGFTVTISPGSWTMNLGQTKVFTASALGGSEVYSYQWFVDGLTQSEINPEFNYTPTSSGSYTISVIATDPLFGTANSSLVVVVNFVLSVSVAPVSRVLDVGQSQMFTATFSGGSGIVSYQWYLDNSAITGATAYSYTYTGVSAGSHTLYVIVTDSASVPVSKQSDAVSVTVNSALVAPILSASASTVNQDQSSVLSSSVVFTGTFPYSYQWLSRASGAGSYSPINGATSPSYSFVTSGSTVTGTWSFELQVTDAAGAPPVTSNAVSIVVNAVPTVSVSPSSWVMDVGQSKIFTATSAGGSGSYAMYQWYVGGAAQSGATSSTFSYSPGSAGFYSITATVTDSLSTTSAQSSAASVSVAASPSVAVSPVGPVTLDVGQVRGFTATR